jgi:deazaflavin-dependent oxidoreductase (nitroreductase family)
MTVQLPDERRADDFCYLTTTGRRTGRAHTIEIWFATPEGAGSPLYLLAGGGRQSDWVRNLVATPAVSVRVGEQTWSATAQVIEDAAEREEAARLVFEKYQPGYGGDLSGWRASALPVAVALKGPT